MKKLLRWLFTIVVCIVFSILLYLQHENFKTAKGIYEEQYARNVQNALSSFVKQIEREEAGMYIDIAFQKILDNPSEEYADLFSPTDFPENSIDSIKSASRGKLVLCQRRDLISETSQKIREAKYRQRLRTKEVIEAVLSTWLDDIHTKSLRERVNFDNFEQTLTDLLADNGINDKFQFNVTDQVGRLAYGKYFTGENLHIYSQRLFPNESTNSYTLNIAIDQREELGYDIAHLLIPSTSINILLFLCFAIIIIAWASQKKLSKTKNDFINNLTHELKTPISSISLAAQLMQDDSCTKSPELLKRISQILTEETKRLSFQVEKVLQLSALDKDKSLMNFKLLDVHDIIENATNNFSLKIESCHGALQLALDAQNSVALIDELHFTNVIYNLMDNAVKYSSQRNLILKICTWNKGDNLCISIEDNGIGIKKGDLKAIFEPFYRAHTGNRHDVKGFGLGLSYVKRIISNHKGHIAVSSEYGIGTKFTITIPNNK